MTSSTPVGQRDATPPDDLVIRREPREPAFDPTLGVDYTMPVSGEPPHRLVAIGHSLTHGFQSGAIFNTDLSYPAIIAHELGCLDRLRFPTYDGLGGLPLNIELLLRDLEQRYGPDLDPWELPLALFRARQFANEVEEYWERGAGRVTPVGAGINHVLAVFGWDLRDALEKTGKACLRAISKPGNDMLMPKVDNSGDVAALRVYPLASDAYRDYTLFDAAAELGRDTAAADAGIETLIVFLGANNALGAVTNLRLTWSAAGYDSLDRKKTFTVWRPTHFKAELQKVADQVRRIKARHVVWCTVPHVTVAPIARGLGKGKVRPGSRYFPHYTRPWIDEADFDPARDRTSPQTRHARSTARSTSTTTTSPPSSKPNGPPPKDRPTGAARRSPTGTCWT
jgi:hypothetical protein